MRCPVETPISILNRSRAGNFSLAGTPGWTISANTLGSIWKLKGSTPLAASCSTGLDICRPPALVWTCPGLPLRLGGPAANGSKKSNCKRLPPPNQAETLLSEMAARVHDHWTVHRGLLDRLVLLTRNRERF